ncbi:MAG: hypothetical protein DMG07_03205 [Acidobacteria bacterium]|nr:MAG: hypothetical protein DMG07_03205 [Acidobacteriota bacterium]
MDWDQILEGLRAPATLEELRRTPFFAARGHEIEALLGTPEIVPFGGAEPRLGAFVRVAQWNIEKGLRFERVLATLETDAVLRWADVVLLNEADFGMNRSGNRHVARDLARALGMHMAFAPVYIELTRGTGEELRLDGENRESLQGNAVLSRHPILEARSVPLPACFEPYHFHEKRYGRRNCLWARLQVGSRAWWVGAVHLEVRNTPRCRAKQVRRLIARLPGPAGAPYLLGGDLNCNGFSRGTLLRTLVSVWRLLARPVPLVEEDLRRPERGSEPLFEVLRRQGFRWEGLNASGATASTTLDGLEDARLLPGWLRARIERRLAGYNHVLDFKLDWLLARGVRPLRAGEARDGASGLRSLGPGCAEVPRLGPERISDHAPIYADVALNDTAV